MLSLLESGTKLLQNSSSIKNQGVTSRAAGGGGMGMMTNLPKLSLLEKHEPEPCVNEYFP